MNINYFDENILPTKVRIDLCNMCQLNCVTCWTKQYEEIIKRDCGGFGYVTFDTFKNFVDNHPYIREIEVTNNGDIFLNPDLLEIVMYANQKHIILTAKQCVNLNNLPEYMADTLVNFGFDTIKININGATPETYSIYHKNGDFNKVIENIKLINKYKEKYNSEYPKLTYKFTVFGHNEHEIDMAKELAKSLNMEIEFYNNYVGWYSPINDLQRVKEKTESPTFNIGLKEKYDIFTEDRKYQWFYCSDLFNDPQINWNGDFIGCVLRKDDGFGLNINVFEEGLEKIYHLDKILYAKKMLLDYSVEPREDIPCASCYIYRFLKANNYKLF